MVEKKNIEPKAKKKELLLRLDAETLARLDRHAARMSVAGLAVSRTAACRVLLMGALEAAERDAATLKTTT